MSSIIIATMPIHGHVTPLLAVARRFVERGDRVRFVTGARFARAVEAAGAEYLPLPAEADFDDRRDLRSVRWEFVEPDADQEAVMAGPGNQLFRFIGLRCSDVGGALWKVSQS